MTGSDLLRRRVLRCGVRLKGSLTIVSEEEKPKKYLKTILSIRVSRSKHLSSSILSRDIRSKEDILHLVILLREDMHLRAVTHLREDIHPREDRYLQEAIGHQEDTRLRAVTHPKEEVTHLKVVTHHVTALSSKDLVPVLTRNP